MSSSRDARALHKGSSLPSKNMASTGYRRGFLSSQRRYPMPLMEECQFLVKLKGKTKHKLQVSKEEEEEEKKNMEAERLVTLMVQADRVIVVRKMRSWGWNVGSIRRYGYSAVDFYFESGTRSRTGEGLFTFHTEDGERIHTRITMMKEFCHFDLYCQRGVILDLLLVNPSNRSVASFRDKQRVKKDTSGRRTSTGSLP